MIHDGFELGNIPWLTLLPLKGDFWRFVAILASRVSCSRKLCLPLGW